MKTIQNALVSTIILRIGLLASTAGGQTVPSILTQPVSQTNYTGETVRFTVSAAGSADLSYRWQKNAIDLEDGSNVWGIASSSLTLSNLSLADAGNYTVTVSDSQGSCSSTSATLTVYSRLVKNGGFETGDFSFWSSSGNFSALQDGVSAPYAYSGQSGAQMGSYEFPGYLAQTVPTSAGQLYQLSFWLNSPDGLGPNEFLVNWNGTNLFDSANLGALGWTNMQFVVCATGTNTLLQFGFRNDPSYFGFDDVSLVPLAGLQPVGSTGKGPAFVWNALAGFRYQAQYTTNLSQDAWSNLGDILVTPTNRSVTNAAPANCGPRGFFRVLLVP